jgi:hypothetical protein
MTFSRPHHQRIAAVLEALDSGLLKELNCLFAGGTAIALRYGEYRESIDIDFLVSNLASYRYLRNLVPKGKGIEALMRSADAGRFQYADVRSDQYGIRTKVFVDGKPIKFEIVLEGRIGLAPPGKRDSIVGVATLTAVDMAASKLLANSDRGMDLGMHCRDIIDLAMINLDKSDFNKAVSKAETAYGEAILQDLSKVIALLRDRDRLLENCMDAMDISVPRALLWQNISKLRVYHLE